MQVHEAGIVSPMPVHKVRVLITQSGEDFAQFDEIDVISREDVLSRTRPD